MCLYAKVNCDKRNSKEQNYIFVKLKIDGQKHIFDLKQQIGFDMWII